MSRLNQLRRHHCPSPKLKLSDRKTLQSHPFTLQVWILRLILTFDEHDENLWEELIINSAITNALEIAKVPKDKRGRKQVLNRLRRSLTKIEAEATGPLQLPGALAANIQSLAALMGMAEVDEALLSFIVLLHREPLLHDLGELANALKNEDTYSLLEEVLKFPAEQIATALSSRSRLHRSGLVSLNSEQQSLPEKFEFVSRRLPLELCSRQTDCLGLFKDIMRSSPAPELAWSDFHHLGKRGELLLQHLRHCTGQLGKGANILLHGPTGTGKTQLVRALARELCLELFEVTVKDADDDPICGEKRVRALSTAQGILSSKRAIILFDEIEDVCPTIPPFGSRGVGQARKGWINGVLEEASVPTVWVTNNVGAMDAAYVRRFDIVIEVDNAPRAVRRNLIARVAPTLGKEMVNRLLDAPSATPAVICRAARVAESMRPVIASGGSLDPYVELLVDGVLKAQENGTLMASASPLPDFYRPEFVNADQSLGPLVEGIARYGSARLCLFGPPGTGKTAFGCWLAERLGRPLLVKRASDLISPFVGMTERLIAKAFAEATADQALLLIDEVDSFLQNRAGAQRSWEVTHVNEMLTQMEAYAGVFIATTNLMEGLDPASLRRFDLKVRFDFLKPAQAKELLAEHLTAQGLPAATEAELTGFDRIDRLTPGDFAAVARRTRFQPLASAPAWIAALADEVRLKTPLRRPLGFHAAQ
jgi:SpoVK/Ycf46/Vps4 family AAA+-type ATPase